MNVVKNDTNKMRCNNIIKYFSTKEKEETERFFDASEWSRRTAQKWRERINAGATTFVPAVYLSDIF